MSFYSTYPASVSTNPSIGGNGGIAPTSSTEVGGVTPGGLLQPISVDSSGNQNVNVVSSTLPTGAATAANQSLQITQETATAGSTATTATNTGAIATSVASIDTKTPTVGQKTMAASSPVVIASDQSTLPISAASLPLPTGAATSALQTTGNSALGSILLDLTNGTQITQVTGTVPLPTGASTSALQSSVQGSVGGGTAATASQLAGAAFNTATLSLTNGQQVALQVDSAGNLKTNLVTGSVTTVIPSVSPTGSAVPASADYAGMNVAGTLTGLTGTANGLKVDGSAVTQPISAAALPLPTGASTSANQTTANTSLASIVTNTANIPTVGQKTSAASLPVVLASDQSALPITTAAKVLANAPTVTTYATPITSSAYVTIVASTSLATTLVELFDSSGVALYFAVGAASSEVNQFVIYPGGNGQVPLAIPAGSRISYKAVSATATGASAYNVLNLYK